MSMLRFLVNNKLVETELPAGSALVDFIRNELHLYGTKIGCREGDCGACTVLVGERVDGALRYRAMTSCLAPLGNANGKHIVTIEGINQEKLTLIQQAFVEHNGTQCGFCTPGFILSLYAFCLGDKPFTVANALEAIAGNICRCTGYKAIERALVPILAKLQELDRQRPLSWLVEQNFLPEYFTGIQERLAALPVQDGPAPGSGMIIAGGTDLLIQAFEAANDAPQVNLVAKGDNRIEIAHGRCILGAACTITQIKESRELNQLLPGLDDYLGLMASTPIRNMATVGGNVANGSPIGDLAVMLLALDATLLMSYRGRKRELPLREFALGYKHVAKEAEEVIDQVSFEVPDRHTHFSFEKTSKRIHLDMATVNSAMRVVLEGGIVRKASFAVGGLGPTLRHLDRTAQYLVGKSLSNATFAEANRIAQSEITPRSRADYKRSLVRQQLLIHLMSFAPETVTLEAVK
jgi:xanthine dehydrogenase small subunit